MWLEECMQCTIKFFSDSTPGYQTDENMSKNKVAKTKCHNRAILQFPEWVQSSFYAVFAVKSFIQNHTRVTAAFFNT